MCEIEILGRSLRWTQEGLEVEADKYHPSLLEGLGLSEEPKTGNGAAVKPEKIGQEEDEECLMEPQRRGSGTWRPRCTS